MKDFTVSAMILNKKKIQEELRREIGNKEYVIDTYGEETEEYEEENGFRSEREMGCTGKLN